MQTLRDNYFDAYRSLEPQECFGWPKPDQCRGVPTDERLQAPMEASRQDQGFDSWPQRGHKDC
jgi:hypothetical protein